ncbi:MAG: S8 family serine peptidase, partial [Gemmatimonadales bacterium]
MKPRRVLGLALVAAGTAACGGATRSAPAASSPRDAPPPPGATAPRDATELARAQPVVPPAAAFAAGFMPLRSTGVETFRRTHPTYDGRGVLIAILDSGIDPGVAGLITTTTGVPKLVDVRDFSREGRVALTAVAPAPDGTVMVAGRRLLGARRVARVTSAATWYAGVFRELPLGPLPAGDVNGDGTNTDEFPLVVVKATDGWAVFIDTNLNGSLEDEMPLHDYRQGRETIALGRRPITLAANLGEVTAGGAPVLDLVFDTSGHGTHVGAIAAGHNLFNVAGFHGVAPGAQLIGLKIANDARGGVSVHGSIMRAMEYAVRFAQQRGLPVVLNLSFGVGNEREGGATIDSLVNTFLTSHPDVVLTVAAGNDGPGLSTLGFPGSADLALTVGALFPGPFARPAPPGQPAGPDFLGWWSARGGELAKPDLVAPGVAFAAVPAWDTGNEIKTGTSMAAPHAAGLVACLISGLVQEGRRVSASELIQALRMSARPLAGGAVLDQGAGIPRLDAAYRWLGAGHQGSTYLVRAGSGASAAFRRGGLAGPADTLEVFRVRHAGGLRAAQFRLRVDQPWLSTAAELTAGPRETSIPVRYRAAALATPGVYVGRVAAYWPSDTLAGPLFTLVNTIVVPHELSVRTLADHRRSIPAGQTARYFMRAGPAGATLQVAVTLADSLGQAATVRLFEPNGQPLRGVDEIALGEWQGDATPGTARLEVRAEDLVTGVYELTVTAAPLGAATVGVRAELGPVAIAALEA